MWIHEVAPERLAELFHHYHQALTPEISGKGSEGHGSWKEVSPQEKKPAGRGSAPGVARTGIDDQRTREGAAVLCPARRSGMGLLDFVEEACSGNETYALTNSLGISYPLLISGMFY